ncbi:MAG: glycosyltransferase family 39 protein, partial [Actinobacteria bacterium]|nr:glycosyltransferase family 39 protein [Actinomycetota bacterium]
MAVGESWLVFGLSVGLNLAAVYLVAIQLKLFLPEAMASAVQAWLLLAGNLLGFVALGASLPPLAALLQLPLALLPPVQQSGLSANLATAIAGALTCALLNLILAGWKLGRAWRYPAVALLASNPLLLFYSGAGSPDVPAVLFVVLSIHLFLLWLRHHESRPAIALASLISMGFAAGLASLARYEAVVYAALLLALLWWQASRTGPSHAGRVAALLITYAVPVISVLGAWAWLNLLVLNDPSSGPGYLAAGMDR